MCAREHRATCRFESILYGTEYSFEGKRFFHLWGCLSPRCVFVPRMFRSHGYRSTASFCALCSSLSLLHSHLGGRGCKEAALEGVIRVFDRLDATAEAANREDLTGSNGHTLMRPSGGGRLRASSTEELHYVEGTILLHFNFAMKQDHSLATCLLKGFQRRAAAPEIGRAFSPFRLALLLSMARIQRFCQPVLDLVQDIVTDCLAYDHTREGSTWLEVEEKFARGARRVSTTTGQSRRKNADDGSDDDLAAASGASSDSSAGVVERVLLTVVRSSRGWDHLVGSLLKLGLQLLDRGGVAMGTGSGSAAGVSKGMLEKLQASQSQRAALRSSHLGRVILMETFKTHEVWYCCVRLYVYVMRILGG